MKNSNFTEGGIVKPLIMFVFPIMFAMLLQSLYGAVDLLIVGRFSDASNVSAVSTGSQMMHTVTFVMTNLAVGTTILLGQYIGLKRENECGRIIGATIALFALLGIITAVVMQFLSAPFAVLMNAPESAFDQTVAYTRICMAGAVFIVAYNILGSIFRGIGNARMPLITVAVSAVLNILGDLLLVAVFHMGAAGAAIATVAAQAFSVLISLLVIRRTGLPFSFRMKDIGFHGDIIRRILRLGIPIALQDLLVSVSFLVILSIVNSLGVIVSAGVGVAEKLCGFIMLVPSAFSQAMASFVAQNYGAAKMDRAVSALKWGIGISFACGCVLGSLAFFNGIWLSSIFSSDPQVCLASAQYLKAYGIDCLLTAFLFCFIGFFNGCARTRFVMIQGIAGAFLGRVPLSFVFSRIQPVSVFRIGLATPCSSLLQIILCILYFLKIRKELLCETNHEIS